MYEHWIKLAFPQGYSTSEDEHSMKLAFPKRYSTSEDVLDILAKEVKRPSCKMYELDFLKGLFVSKMYRPHKAEDVMILWINRSDRNCGI